MDKLNCSEIGIGEIRNFGEICGEIAAKYAVKSCGEVSEAKLRRHLWRKVMISELLVRVRINGARVIYLICNSSLGRQYPMRRL